MGTCNLRLANFGVDKFRVREKQVYESNSKI